jgi:hypothetical protein
MKEFSAVEDIISTKASVESDYKSYTKLLPVLASLEKSISMKGRQIMSAQNKVVVEKNLLRDVDVMISRYLKQEASIESNLKIEESRSTLARKISVADRRINEKNDLLSETTGRIGILTSEKEKRDKNAAMLKTLESEIQSYSHYVSAVSRDGIPFELISQAVPIIEKEVNTILSQIVEFSVNIQTDGKNVVTNIVYNDRSWPLELASGLEKFLTSLVIRVALINISNLPRPNFIAIDEGFGCADADNLAAMNALFSTLKANFDFMLIISHLDSMKDMVDHTIEIKKENGFSKITV